MYNFRLPVLQYFMRAGYAVHVIASKDDFAQQLLEQGCVVHDVVFNNRTLNPVADVKLYRQLVRLYREIQPQKVFHYFVKPNIYGSLAANYLGIPSVPIVAGLGYAFIKKQWLLWLVKNLYKKAFAHVPQVWFLNKENADVFVAMQIIPASKVFILPGEGVDASYFKPQPLAQNPKPFVFLMLTRMLQKKGVSVFAQAAEILLNKGYAIECRVMGFFEDNHPDTIPLEDIQAWKAKGLLHFPGFTQDVKPALQQAHCFVLPTLYNEGVPRSLLEAACMHIPMIATNQTGCREIIDHQKTGLLCEINNAQSLAQAMETVLTMPRPAMETMVQNAHAKVVQQFEVSHILRHYQHAVDTL